MTGREKEQGRNPSQRNDFERQCLGFETRNHDEGPTVKELIIQMSTTKQEIEIRLVRQREREKKQTHTKTLITKKQNTHCPKNECKQKNHASNYDAP